MAIQRVHNWRQRLGRMLRSERDLPFAWGTLDCALHCANCIKAMTGVDPGASYRGTYHDEAGAIAIFGSDLAAFAAGIAASLGMPEVLPTFAQSGDIVHVDNGTAYGALGVVGLDNRFALCISDTHAAGDNLARLGMDKWKRAWHVAP
jgi:uncharacterized protein DUF6950